MVPVLMIEDGDVDHLACRTRRWRASDELVHGLRFELRGQGGLDVVHDRQLGGASLRLVEQPRVLERHAETGGERGEQAHVGLGERVRAVEVLERDAAAQLTTEVSGASSTDRTGSPWMGVDADPSQPPSWECR